MSSFDACLNLTSYELKLKSLSKIDNPMSFTESEWEGEGWASNCPMEICAGDHEIMK